MNPQRPLPPTPSSSTGDARSGGGAVSQGEAMSRDTRRITFDDLAFNVAFVGWNSVPMLVDPLVRR